MVNMSISHSLKDSLARYISCAMIVFSFRTWIILHSLASDSHRCCKYFVDDIFFSLSDSFKTVTLSVVFYSFNIIGIYLLLFILLGMVEFKSFTNS